MLITLKRNADLEHVQRDLRALGQWTQTFRSGGEPILQVKSHSERILAEVLRSVDGVLDVAEAAAGHPLVDEQAGGSIAVGSVRIGGGEKPVLMAGPCSVESPEQIDRAAAMVARTGASILRGGTFKPRSSPYSFSGHGKEALDWMRAAADAHGLAMVTEVVSEGDAEDVAAVADMLQVGSRNMQNFALLRAVGATQKPVLLKRSMAARLEEWCLAGEHLLAAGAAGVVFCERGIIGFDPSTRNLLDLGAVAILKHVFGQPVVVDPSHAVGRRDLIVVMARAALAAGADGLIVEAHPDAGDAFSDGPQALGEEHLEALG